MREEIKNWLKQAEEDLDTARYNLKGKKYYIVAFMSQQACEKALKAYLMLKTKRRFFGTHSLTELGKSAKVPENILNFLRRLAPEYTISRYPDVTDSLPYENYSFEIANEQLNRAEEVLKWLRLKMRS